MVECLFAAALSLLCGVMVLSAQVVGQADLARLLANEADRQRAISLVAASKAERLPLLLNLAKAPTREVDEHDLLVGLADAFGALKVTEAIPFLLRNITLRRDIVFDLRPWLKAEGAIELSFPAAAALISIGPDASRAVMQAYDQPMKPEERLAAIFVVSRIRGVPEAKLFLSTVVSFASLEHHFAQDGMKNVEK